MASYGKSPDYIEVNNSAVCSSSSLSVSTADESSPAQTPVRGSGFRLPSWSSFLALHSNNNNNNEQPSQPPLDDVVDHLLSKAESPEQARDLLRGMVCDLLRENDGLKRDLQAKDEELTDVQKEKEVLEKDYREGLKGLQESVERAVGGGSCGFAIANSEENSNSDQHQKKVWSPEQATTMVVQSLSNKVELLHVEKETLQQELAKTIEKLQDVESINETRLYKIEALEAQFQSINTSSRQHNPPPIKATCRRQGPDSPTVAVTLPKRTHSPRVVTPTKKSTKKSSLHQRSTPRRPVANVLEVGPGMGEI